MLGDVQGGKMCMNDAGGMVADTWRSLPTRFPNLNTDEFVVMPNHFHAIMHLTESCRGEPRVRPLAGNDGQEGDHKDRPYGTAPCTVGRIIQAFKSMTTLQYVRGVNDFGWRQFCDRFWQQNYWEHIIRSGDSLERCQESSKLSSACSGWIRDFP